MSPVDPPRTWRLLGPGGAYDSRAPGTLFFADEEGVVSAGYRPCGVCMRDEYARWRVS
jgi:hypothetical protein